MEEFFIHFILHEKLLTILQMNVAYSRKSSQGSLVAETIFYKLFCCIIKFVTLYYAFLFSLSIFFKINNEFLENSLISLHILNLKLFQLCSNHPVMFAEFEPCNFLEFVGFGFRVMNATSCFHGSFIHSYSFHAFTWYTVDSYIIKNKVKINKYV